MPISVRPAKDGLKLALRRVAAHMPTLAGQGATALDALRRLGPRAAAQGDLPQGDSLETNLRLEDVLSIPVPDTNAEEAASDAAIEQGQHLARQEQWDLVETRIRAADHARTATPGGTPIADLIAYGARADVVNAVEHALSEGLPLTDRVLLDGIMSLERVRLELNRGAEISTLVALAHLDIAWACRRTADRRPSRNTAVLTARAEAHLARASKILSQLDHSASASPFVTAARCALYCGATEVEDLRSIADDYIALIKLDPQNPRHMRALGAHLGEQGASGVNALELEARRVAAAQHAHWGAAGYAWVYFDVLARNDMACVAVDVEFFLEGIADIVARSSCQDRINLLSAYCSVSLKPRGKALPEAARVRAEISEAAGWLIRDHLREVHPMIWAHAGAGFDNDAQVRSVRQFAETGRKAALRAIADLFRDEIEAGKRVVFTPEGPQLQTG